MWAAVTTPRSSAARHSQLGPSPEIVAPWELEQTPPKQEGRKLKFLTDSSETPQESDRESSDRVSIESPHTPARIMLERSRVLGPVGGGGRGSGRGGGALTESGLLIASEVSMPESEAFDTFDEPVDLTPPKRLSLTIDTGGKPPFGGKPTFGSAPIPGKPLSGPPSTLTRDDSSRVRISMKQRRSELQMEMMNAMQAGNPKRVALAIAAGGWVEEGGENCVEDRKENLKHYNLLQHERGQEVVVLYIYGHSLTRSCR
jgi:hypothetical protein